VKLVTIFMKTLREMARDRLSLALTLAFAPLFVGLYALLFPGGSSSYGILVLNRDEGVRISRDSTVYHSQKAVRALERVSYSNGNPLLRVRGAKDSIQATALLRNREAVAFVSFPDSFSRSIAAGTSPFVTFGGDLTNPYYTPGAMMAVSALDGFAVEFTGHTPPVRYRESPLGGSGARSEFEIYVPGLMIFAVIMLVFTSSMTLTREVESRTLVRLQLTGVRAFDLLGGVSLSLVLVGLISTALTFAAAIGLGFRSQGPVWITAVAAGLTAFSIIGVGLLTACFAKTVTQAFLLANFPLGFFMFFSGAVFPMPPLVLFRAFGHAFNLYEILPPSHAVTVLNKVFTLGAGLGGVLYELTALSVLSALYFCAGVFLFKRTHLRPE
jgi:ABC-2 type transport system permease protein